MLWNRQGWKEEKKCPIRRSKLISAVQSAVCVQRSLVIDWKPWNKTRGYFFIHVWAECVISWQAVCLEAWDDPGECSATRLGLFDRRRRGSQQVGVCVCEWRRTRSNLPLTPRVDGAALTSVRWEFLSRCIGCAAPHSRGCGFQRTNEWNFINPSQELIVAKMSLRSACSIFSFKTVYSACQGNEG